MAKSKWDDVKEKFILIEGWARDGLTDEQICENLGISRETFYKYKREHSDFSDLLKRSKEVVDREVENALYKKALEGDTTAMIFWLKNRKPKDWRDKVHTELSTGEEGLNININLVE